MPNQRVAHTPDIDLVDFVDGVLNAAEARLVEEHLSGCLSCRVKRQRMADTPPIAMMHVGDMEVPDFKSIDTEDIDPSGAAPGDLWLTAADDAVMVLVTKVRPNDWGVVVVPVVLDIEIADSGTLVLDDTASPIDVPIAIYSGMANSLPISALRGRVIPTRPGVDLLRITDTDPGVYRGLPLEGPADPRHEVRQYIADQLVTIDPPVAEPAEEPLAKSPALVPQPMDQATIDARFVELQIAFLERIDTSVEPLRLPGIVPSNWKGIAQIRSFNERILVFLVEGGLPEDRGPALALCELLEGSAVAIRTNPESPLIDLYSKQELSGTRSVQTGELVTAPRRSGLATLVLSHYLDDMVTIPAVDRSPSERGTAVDPKEILRAEVDAALAEQVAAGKSAHIPPKRDGLMSVEGINVSLMEVLQWALSEPLDPNLIIDLSDGRNR